MLTAAVLALGFWAGQLVDGHVHSAPHGGVLAHCGPYLVEVVVRRGPDVAEKLPVAALTGQTRAVVPDARIQVWLLTEKEMPVMPAGRKLKVRSTGHHASLPAQDDGFQGKLAVSDREVPLDLELIDGGRVQRAHLVWSALDERERLDDGPGLPRPQRQRPEGGLVRPDNLQREVPPLR
jgi:hypothetical protein